MTTLPSIEEAQNSPYGLRLRAAIDSAYGVPKLIFGFLIFLSVVNALVSIANNIFEWKKEDVLAITGIIVFGIENAYRLFAVDNIKKGAILGDMFDFYVFGLPMPAHRDAEKLQVSEVAALAGAKNIDRYRDWYFNLSRFAPEKQALACQLTNAAWDFFLRRRLRNVTILILLSYLGATSLFGLLEDMKYSEFLVKVFAPTLPLAYVFFSLFIDSNKALTNLHGIKNATEQELRSQSSGSQSLVYGNQEHLFKHRQSAFPIPSFIHNMLKSSTEREIGVCLDLIAEQSR